MLESLLIVLSNNPTPSFLQQAEALLNQLEQSSIKLGTQRMLNLCELLGQPQNRRPVVHVAGTNGKGSVCAMLTHGLMAQGLKVGTTVSPHLCTVAERVLINAQPLTPFDFFTAVQQLWKRLTHSIGEFSGNNAEWPTYFEFLVLLAFQVFAKTNVDIIILETGLGGRLDATNVVEDPIVTVITSIGYDHMEHLGTTLDSIAQEKAGIFRTNVPVVLGPNLPDEALNALQEKATQLHTGAIIEASSALLHRVSPLTPAGVQQFKNMVSSETIELGLLGNYQKHNLATVLATASILQRQGFIPNMPAFYEGLKRTQWAGRFQYFTQQNLLVDGSHNQDGFISLSPALLDTFGEQRSFFWLVSLRKNRPVPLLLNLLKRHVHQTMGIVVTRPQAGNPALYHCPIQLRQQIRIALPELETRPIWAAMAPPEGLWLFQQWVNNQPANPQSALGIVTGSLYTAGEILSLVTEQEN